MAHATIEDMCRKKCIDQNQNDNTFNTQSTICSSTVESAFSIKETNYELSRKNNNKE